MEDITTRTKIGRNWYKPPMENKTSGKPIPKPNKTHDKAPLKCHKCGSTSHLANTCPKKTRIKEIGIEKDDTKETKDVSVHESDSEPPEVEELPDELSIEKDYLDKIHTNWKDKLMPIEGINISSASQNMHPLGISEAEIIFPHFIGSILLKV
ncbi:hypothetical protein O181_103888 [Austropuccinia psidii MF-1]|uniref:CCHC-type domain-containing protein n=1 Tax=Austropuccinia psidii MF-1 TaxID=1389203 RepID=A0A9Q3JJ44_9BASI|nr:hypothetical protein [Austropuccinia psidii MF-1]